MSATPEKPASGDRPIVPPTGLRLRLTAVGPAGAASCETTQPVILVGSRRDCHLPLNGPDVSKVHCAIVHTGRALLVCDLGSRYGTFLNSKPVRVGPLNVGDRLRVGPVDVAIEFLQPPRNAPLPASGEEPARRPQALPLSVGGRLVELGARPAIIGRRSTSDIIVDTPDVSLAHALLFAFDDRAVVSDLGSRSGTYLNGQRIQLAWVRDGDQLSIGGETLAIARGVDTAAVQQERTQRALPPAGPGFPVLLAPSPAPAAGNLNSVEGLLQAVLSDLLDTRRKLDGRAVQLDRREAELDALGTQLELRCDHIDNLKADLSRRCAEIERAAAEAGERLAQALSHEQAVAIVWGELERWRATVDAHHRDLRDRTDEGVKLPASDPDSAGFPNATPLAKPLPPPDVWPLPGANVCNA